MPFFHTVKADLNLMDTKLFSDFSGDQRAIGEENGPKWKVSEPLVHLPKIRVEQRFPSRKEKSQPLDFLKLLQHLLDLFP
jgi:hypothetical protein